VGWRRWLDPPEAVERKRRRRAAGIHPPRAQTLVGIEVPIGCTVPMALFAGTIVMLGALAEVVLLR
jgi:hypothetical protein